MLCPQPRCFSDEMKRNETSLVYHSSPPPSSTAVLPASSTRGLCCSVTSYHLLPQPPVRLTYDPRPTTHAAAAAACGFSSALRLRLRLALISWAPDLERNWDEAVRTALCAKHHTGQITCIRKYVYISLCLSRLDRRGRGQKPTHSPTIHPM